MTKIRYNYSGLLLCGLLIVLLAVSSCTHERPVNFDTKSQQDGNLVATQDEDPDQIFPGILRVKFSAEVGEELYDPTPSLRSTTLRSSGDSAIDQYLQEIGASEMRRVFPNTGKFEQRKRREGMHLWYDITFDTTTRSTLRAVDEVQELRGVIEATPVYKMEQPSQKVEYITAETLPVDLRANTQPFNDRFLSLQWHYHNSARFLRHQAGADINLYEAWEIETGKPNVIVAIVDQGVDYLHEDLATSLRINETELNGKPDTDNDGNGYKNDVYGFNFATYTGEIQGQSHGTHVAGTVAARNNNGVGVCGVAGGDGTPDSGVKIISCQVFGKDEKNKAIQAKNFGEAIVYAADNGAVIAQNSWGYTYPGPSELDGATRVAIDYFIKYAGCDEEGNQLPGSPMKGGVCIFAAGNDGLDYRAFPGAYDPVVAVSAMSPDFGLADYTNRGAWVDVMAPGGSIFFHNGQIASTLPNNQYGYMEGTSMACPHVSGIAALIVSKFGGEGFTNDDLKYRLENSLRNEPIYQFNPKHSGRLGNGYIDAAKALATDLKKAPHEVSDLELTPTASTISYTFSAVKDEDDGTAARYYIYIRTASESKETVLQGAPIALLKAHYIEAGQKLSGRLTKLDPGTEYFVYVVAEDRWGHRSAPAEVTVNTRQNLAPTITLDTALPLKLSYGETQSLELKVEEPDEDRWSYTVSGEKRGVGHSREGDTIILEIRAVHPKGSYKVIVEVTDRFQSSNSIEIPFEVS